MSDAAVGASTVPTLRAVHADGGGPWALATIAQLVAILDHVAHRPADPAPARTAALEAALATMADSALVPAAGTADERAAAALVACVGREDADAARVRATLRAVLVAELDDELRATALLLDAFRGRLPDA